MKLDFLTVSAQNGLVKWASFVHGDELLFDGIAGNPEYWAWVWFQLREAEDRPEWFPHGKWATVQRIESILTAEARRV